MTPTKNCLLLFAITALLSCSKHGDVEQQSQVQPTQVESYNADSLISSTLPDIAKALENGETTSVQLVKAYLARIDAIDNSGPELRAVIMTNPDAIKRAAELDEMRAEGSTLGPLHGIPILLKDNIDTADAMPTTAGALALKDNYRTSDSPLVEGLRNAGAIILGKTNLSQWANFRSEDSMSGWSLLGGQVKNPHILNRNPCGSSSGSGAAAAASLAAGTVGTETNGSIICPSNANGIVGIKPTVGIVSQKGIIPISESQDTAGPMTKSVMGAAMMMNAMVNSDINIDFTADLQPDALRGVRVGVLDFARAEYAPLNDLFDKALISLTEAGAELVPIKERPAVPDGFWTSSYDVLKYEFKAGLDAYLASTDPSRVPVRDLGELIAFNNSNTDTELALFDQSIFDASQAMDSLDSEGYKNAVTLVQRATRQEGIDKLLTEHNVQVLVAPSGVFAPAVDAVNGDVWPSGWPGYGSAAAIAGYPHVTVPMGAFRNMPAGLSFIGTAHQDASIIGFAYAYEQQSQQRVSPQYLPLAESEETLKRQLQPFVINVDGASD